ncbi:hypothetical protein G6F24_015431 [Rhizopus arrhizus]|nr:hypothetical protein G6F24_015431 [Rhizopus arrhizus]
MLAHVVDVTLARYHLDHPAEQDVPGIGVRPAAARREIERTIADARDQPIKRNRLRHQGIDLLFGPVEIVVQAAGVGQQLAQGHLMRVRGVRQVPGQRIIQAEFAGLLQLHDRSGGELLGDRADLERRALA